MEINIPVDQDFLLTITDKPDGRALFSTSRLRKGLLMSYRGLDLTEEAVGFGLPVLKRGLEAVFPGEIELSLLRNDSTWVVTAVYTISLVEKIARTGGASVNSRVLYAAKNSLAALIRRFPPARGFLTALSSSLRRLLGWETAYENGGFSTQIRMTYTLDEQTKVLSVEAGLDGLPHNSVTEVIVMNEQGAHYFDQYRDSSGAYLSGKQIGCWDDVDAEEASFASSTHRIAFTLPRVPGTRLIRGRELVGSRLAWAGFGYSFPPTTRRFSYTVRIEKLP